MARVSAKRIKPTAQKPKTPATKPKETKSEGPTRGYQRMPPEMRLWIWRSVPMTHGVHFFKWDLGVVQDPAAPSYFNVPMQEVEVLLSPSCKSSWRSRNKMRRIDKYAWDVLKTELRRPSTKLMWPTPPLTKNPSIKRPGVFVNAEDDIVCFRPTRSPGPTWEMRPIDTRQFAGLKRVALMYNCPFPIMYRSVDVRDSEIIAEFLAFFPDVEKFYLITELNRDVLKFPTVSTTKELLKEVEARLRCTSPPHLRARKIALCDILDVCLYINEQLLSYRYCET
ncbi:hypothetical protein GGR54DRAFT_590647 [Hypoxylon sp. NC1633]|nr:hypothetical protein GGR54DRAFT_590647 [Hypoxylon sp. NC1633]